MNCMPAFRAIGIARACEVGLSSRSPRRATHNDCEGQGSDAMRMNSLKFSLFASVAFAALIALAVVPASAQQPAAAAVAIDNDDIGGLVAGPNGAEAGGWGIAETHNLAVRYIKIVATDEQGPHVVAALAKAHYNI